MLKRLLIRVLRILGWGWLAVVALLIVADMAMAFVNEGLRGGLVAIIRKLSPFSIVYYLTTLAAVVPGAVLVYLADRWSGNDSTKGP